MSILPKESVKAFAEACGVSDLEDEVAAALASDLEYKLREMTQEADKFRRHAKRRRLTPEDINLAMRLRNLEPLYGYSALAPSSSQAAGFRKAGEVAGLSTFYMPDEVVDLQSLINAELPERPHDVTFTSHWLAIEGVQPEIPQNPGVVTGDADSAAPVAVVAEILADPVAEARAAAEDPTTEAGKAAAAAAAGGAAADGTGATADPAAPNQDASKAAANIGPVVYKPITKHELSLEQQLYYQSVTQGMLEPNNAEYCEKAAASLRRDPGLHSLLPYFAQFVAEKVTSNVGPNAMLAVLSNMVLLTESLLANENLFPEPYLHQLLPSMLTCVVGKTLSETAVDDHWSLRKHAARVVGMICVKFGKKHRVQSRVTKTLIGALLDPAKPLPTHYGAIVTLTGLGPLILDAVLIDSLEKYDQSLSARTADADAATMMAAAKIEEALLDACRVYSTWYAAQTANVGGKAALPDPDINRRYQVINKLFGEKMVMR